MSSYSPTADDYAHILANNPRAFADTSAARTVLTQLRKNPNAFDNVVRLQALRTNYTQGGNPPLTRSPIPASADAGFGNVCVVCAANSPCCLKSGVLCDYSDPTRKLEWPVSADKPKTRILVVAKDPDQGLIYGKLQLEGKGNDCRTGRQEFPGFIIDSATNGRIHVARRTSDIRVGYRAMPSWAMALKDFVPEKFLLGLMIGDTVLSGWSMLEGSKGCTISPTQCVSDGAMQRTLHAIPVAYFELSGEATATVGLHFLTTGIGGSASVAGNLTGKYGALDIAAAASASAIGSSGRAAPSQGRAPGMVGNIAAIISNFSQYVSQSSPAPRGHVDRTGFGSGVRFEQKIKLAGTGIKLEAKKATPDLEAKIGELETELSMTATGTLDFIDLAANIMLSPAGARLVQEARAAVANQENAVRGEVRCEVQVSAEGKLTHKVETGLSILIPAEGRVSMPDAALNKEFGGRLRVRGMAQILIHVEGEVWIASAEAGAAGTLHTGWNWEMKVDNEKKRKKRYYFEGLIARATGYARVGVKSQTSRGPASTSSQNGSSSRKVTATQQGQQASAGDPNWRDPNAERSPLDNGGKKYVLLEPTVAQVTGSAPAWQDY